MKLDSATISKIIKNHIQGVVAYYSRAHAVSETTLQSTLDEIDNVINNTKAALQFGLHHGWMRSTIKQATSDMEIELDDDQSKELAFQLAQAHVGALQKAKDVDSA